MLASRNRFPHARCASPDRSPELLGGMIERTLRDYEAETPVDDQVFAAYGRFSPTNLAT